MVEAICNKLTLKIRKEMPEIDDERAEVINYGLQLLVGEIPKIFIVLLVSWILGVMKLTILALAVTMPYRVVAGGAHFKTHIKCIVATSVFYIGNAMLSKYIVMGNLTRYILTAIVFVFSFLMINLYAPADTEDVPILRIKERKVKKILSYIIMAVELAVSLIIKNSVIANVFLFAVLLQTIAITRPMYKIANNKYGYEEYIKMQNTNLN